MDVLHSVICLSMYHRVVQCIPFRTRNAANLITCMTFQAWFVYQSGRLFYENDDPHFFQTYQNLKYLYGYFLYDLIHLILTDPHYGFIVHHLVGMILIHSFFQQKPYAVLLRSYQSICFLSEVCSPFLNLRPFLRSTPCYRVYMKCIYYMYFLFRILLFPIASFSFYWYTPSLLLAILMSTVYGMSLYWFRLLYVSLHLKT
jgi:TLC domain